MKLPYMGNLSRVKTFTVREESIFFHGKIFMVAHLYTQLLIDKGDIEWL